MRYPKCRSSQGVMKSGFQKNLQRYHCKHCPCYFTEKTRQRLAVSKKLRTQAKKLYLEGLGFRSIGRILGVSHVSILRWIRACDVKKPLSPVKHAPQGIELDEMGHYQGEKKTNDGFGRPSMGKHNRFCG